MFSNIFIYTVTSEVIKRASSHKLAFKREPTGRSNDGNEEV